MKKSCAIDGHIGPLVEFSRKTYCKACGALVSRSRPKRRKSRVK